MARSLTLGTAQHSALPHMQAAATDAGHESHLPVDLSDEADMADSDGELYDLHGDTPPPYAQHDYSTVTQSECAALAITDRKSVGHIIVATVVIYVSWITMQA